MRGSPSFYKNQQEKEKEKGEPASGSVVVITGPTAVGKTDISINVAKQLNGEIVSCDSMQVYKYMDIGTAKAGKKERESVPHHLIDVVTPDEEFNVAKFQRLARNAISDIESRGKIPILVGGTGLYIKAIIDGFLFPWEGKTPKLREALKKEAENKGVDVLYGRLKKEDSKAARKIHPNDTRRIIRALEVYITTGRPISELWQEGRKRKTPFDKLLMIGLIRKRQVLYERINTRCDQMIDSGLIEETKSLLDKGYGNTLTAGQALGYKEIVHYLEGKSSLKEAIDLIKLGTRRYAKRQLIWFRADPRILWIDIGVFNTKDEATRCILSLVKGKMESIGIT